MAKPTTIDAYLAPLPADQREALEKLRAQIKAAAPEAEEYIGYGLAGFKFEGRPLLYFGAATHHCALYGALDAARFADMLKGFKQSKGTIQFTPDRPIPAPTDRPMPPARLTILRPPPRPPTPAPRPTGAASSTSLKSPR